MSFRLPDAPAADRRSSRWWRPLPLIIFSVFVLALLVYAPSGASDENRVAVVVDYGNGQVAARCVGFSEESISGYDALLQTGLPVETDFQSSGAAVCSIDGTGCPANDCFCSCRGGGECKYWSYWQFRNGAWNYSSVGGALNPVSDGAVEGWVWGLSTISQATPPPVMAFDEVCAPAAPDTPTVTFTPSPTLTPVILPTSGPAGGAPATATATSAVVTGTAVISDTTATVTLDVTPQTTSQTTSPAAQATTVISDTAASSTAQQTPLAPPAQPIQPPSSPTQQESLPEQDSQNDPVLPPAPEAPPAPDAAAPEFAAVVSDETAPQDLQDALAVANLQPAATATPAPTATPIAIAAVVGQDAAAGAASAAVAPQPEAESFSWLAYAGLAGLLSILAALALVVHHRRAAATRRLTP